MLSSSCLITYVKVFFMKSKLFLQLITAVFALCTFVTVAKAAPVEEQQAVSWAEQTGQQLIAALGNPDLQSKYHTLDKMFGSDVDTTYIAKFVIGKYWKLFNPEQKQSYLSLFNRYVLSLYKNYPLDFDTDGIDFEITSARINGKFTDVFCKVDLPENLSSENLNYIMLEFKIAQTDGKIKIYDLKIGESSLLLTYRNRFYTMMAEADEDVSWFLEDLEMLTVSNEQNAQQKLLYQ